LAAGVAKNIIAAPMTDFIKNLFEALFSWNGTSVTLCH
jgi:hypothetical protein